MIQNYFKKLGVVALAVSGSILGASESQAQATACSDLFFSEYVEGGSGNGSKAIEIYNPTNAPISLTGYTIKLFANGAATTTFSLALTGTIAAHDVYVIANTASAAAVIAQADIQNNTIANWNGDDAVILYKTVATVETIVDVFGNMGCDPGDFWSPTATSTKSTKDRVLRRKASVTMGITADPSNTPCNFPTLDAEWDDYADTDYTGFGAHTSSCAIPANAPTLNFASATSTVAENVSGGTLNIPVTITNPSATTATSVTVAVATAGGSATSGTDFTITTGTLTFAAGSSTNQNAVLTITDDNIFEGAETINLILSAPSTGAAIGTASTHTVTITDNETAPVISFGTPTAVSVAESAGTVNIPVVLSNASNAAITVQVALATAAGTATAGSDFTFTSPQTVTIPAGATTANATVIITDDAAVESTETIQLILQNAGTGATLGTTNVAYTLSITDNDVASANPIVNFQAAASTVAENVSGGTVTIPVTIASPSATQAVTVNIVVSATPGTATSGTDYTLSTTSVTFPAGSSANQNVTITITDDNIFEGNETLNISLQSPTNGATLGSTSSHTVTITDNETAPTIAFGTPSTVTVAENIGSVNIPVTLSNPSTTPVTVAVALATPAGNATAGTDYTFTTQTLTFAAGTTTQNATLTITNDKLIEGNETINLKLQTATGGTISTTNAYTITIVSDDVIPTYTVAQVTTNNATTFLPDSSGVKVKLIGTIYGVNQRTTGLQLTLIDATGGIGLFTNSAALVPTVAPVEGDRVRAIGTIGHFNGLTQLTIDSIVVLTNNQTLVQPAVVTTLGENTESELITLANPVSLVDPTQWTNNSAGFNVDVTDGTNTYQMRIAPNSDLIAAPAPTGIFMLTGIGGQFDNSDPRDSGYQILPRRLTDLRNVTGVSEDLANAISIYPNPVANVLNLNLSALNTKNATISVVNTLGQVVATMPATATELNVSKFPAGVYSLRIATQQGVAVKRFVKIN